MAKKNRLIHIHLLYLSNERKRRRAKIKVKNNNIKKYNKKKDKYQRERRNSTFSSSRSKTLFAPNRFSLLDYPEEVIGFINKIDECTLNHNIKNIKFDLSDIKQIDLGAICLLLSKLNELSIRKIYNWGTFPKDKNCKLFIQESGFLDRMYDISNDKPYSRTNKNLILNRGFDKTDNAATAKEIRKAVCHLTNKENKYQPIYSIAQEICANSVEHANEDKNKKNWLFATSYSTDYVIFTMTDIGEGILKTIKRKFLKFIKEKMQDKNSIEILINAFEKQYQSRTKDTNRNKGLPKIHKTASKKYIENLIVLTNNVILDFENPENSRIIKNNFKGTFYYWKLNKICIERWENRLKE